MQAGRGDFYSCFCLHCCLQNDVLLFILIIIDVFTHIFIIIFSGETRHGILRGADQINHPICVVYCIFSHLQPARLSIPTSYMFAFRITHNSINSLVEGQHNTHTEFRA
jgi:hypothetical protein